MAMVRKCDRCEAIDGVSHFTVRFEGGTGQADLCKEHAAALLDLVVIDKVIRRQQASGRRRGPSLPQTSIEEIEAQKKKVKK